MKTKIEFEVDIPEGQEFDKFEPLICTTLNGDIAFTGIAKLKPIEPPLELETRDFIDTSLNIVDFGNMKGFNSPAEARDLAKILNYWAEKGKLPDRVVVKSNETSNATIIGGTR